MSKLSTDSVYEPCWRAFRRITRKLIGTVHEISSTGTETASRVIAKMYESIAGYQSVKILAGWKKKNAGLACLLAFTTAQLQSDT